MLFTGGCGFVNIGLWLQKKPIRRNLMVLGHMIYGANFDHRNETLHDQEMSRAVIVALSCWNHILVPSISSNLGRRNCIIMQRYRAPVTVISWPASFSIKYGPLMPPARNPHQTVTRCGCIYFSTITCGFCEPQIRQFWRLTKPSRWKCASSLNMTLLEKSASNNTGQHVFWWLWFDNGLPIYFTCWNRKSL